MKRVKRTEGLTLMEVCVAVAVLGIFAMMSVVGVRFITNMTRERASLEAQRDAQVVLYQIISEIRNSDFIVALSTGSPYQLVLREYDYSNGYDIRTNVNLFSPANISTVTYTYREEEGGYLEKKVDRPGFETNTKKLLKNILKPNDTDYLPFRPLDILPPYNAVEVVFRLAPNFLKDRPRVIRSEAMIRTRAGN